MKPSVISATRLIGFAVLAAGCSSAMAQNLPSSLNLSLSPFPAALPPSRPILLLDSADPQTDPQKLPPVVVPGTAPSHTGTAGFLETLPDKKELEAAPTRHTLLTGLVKDQSMYGKAWFPETMQNPRMDLELSEMELTLFHEEKHGHYFTESKLELEQGIGALTLELEIPYQLETEHDPKDPTDPGDRNDGLSRIEIGGRYPVFQLLSDNGFFDYTCVMALEGAIPTRLHFSKDFEVSPRVYQLIRFGEHLSLQTNLGTEHIIGPDRGGTVTLIYGATLGWAIYPEDLPIPFVLTTIPVLEVNGEHTLTGENEGPYSTSTFATVGVRFNMESIGFFQPRFGMGFVIPLDRGARDEMSWGTIFNATFEF